MCTNILYPIAFVQFHSFLQAAVSFTFTRLSHSISRIHWLYVRDYKKIFNKDKLLSFNFDVCVTVHL